MIDDKLMTTTPASASAKRTPAGVETGPRTMALLARQAGIRSLRGKLNWEGDVDRMRTDSRSAMRILAG